MHQEEKKVVFRFSRLRLADQDRLGVFGSCLAHPILRPKQRVSAFDRSQSRGGEIARAFSFRKEVIQPQVLLRLPCYDFTPIMNYTLGGCSLAVSAPTSSATHFRDVTGGVYKARERIHRGILIRDY